MDLGKWKWYDFMGVVPASIGALSSKDGRKDFWKHLGRGTLSGASIAGLALGGMGAAGALGGAGAAGAGAAGAGAAGGGMGSFMQGAQALAPFLSMMGKKGGQQDPGNMPVQVTPFGGGQIAALQSPIQPLPASRRQSPFISGYYG